MAVDDTRGGEVTHANRGLQGTASLWQDEAGPIPLVDLDPSRAPAREKPTCVDSPPAREPGGDWTLSADDFAAERMLRPLVDAPAQGWRRGIYRLTHGFVTVPPNAD